MTPDVPSGEQQTFGEEIIRWIETHCRVPEGVLIGQPIELRASAQSRDVGLALAHTDYADSSQCMSQHASQSSNLEFSRRPKTRSVKIISEFHTLMRQRDRIVVHWHDQLDVRLR